ncbi:MAG TPA: sigma-70 family RNA polymerase sigma factor, partial [Gemmatimonadales bacterium]|nr:sigma-70 family RNA polymerase sigma factor [Gemmatimonadales bacterium]
ATASDQAAFETLFTPVFPAAYRAALHLTRNQAQAEDAVQQAAFLAWRAFHSFEAGTNFRAWFLRIVTNVCRTEFRRQRRAPLAVSLDEPDSGDAVIPLMAIRERGQTPPDADLITRLESEEISAALASLPPEYRTVATLYFVEDLSYQEIAQIVGCPVGTVRSRLHRGRRLLQRRLLALAREHGVTGSSGMSLAGAESADVNDPDMALALAS